MHVKNSARVPSQERRSLRIMPKSRHVVDYGRTGLQSDPHGAGVSRVHRNRHASSCKRLDNRKDALLFFGGRHWRRVRPGALAADVEDIGASIDRVDARLGFAS